MNDSIHRYFQIGTVRWMSHPRRPLLRSLADIAADADFDAVEITSVADDSERRAAKEILAQSHLQVCFGAQPLLLAAGLNPNAIDETERSAAARVLLRALDEAEFLGAKTLAFMAGKWHKETEQAAFDQLLTTTGELCERAAAKGMNIELEMFDCDVDKAALIGPAPLAAKFAAAVRAEHANFGLLADLSHFPLTGESSAAVIATCRPYLSHFHIGNCVAEKGFSAYGDAHPRFGFAHSANDTPQLLDFLTVLRREGFFRPNDPYVLSFEVKPQPDEDEDAVLAGSKRVLSRAWALLEN